MAKDICDHMNTLEVMYHGNTYALHIGNRFGRLTITDLVRYREHNAMRKGCICVCDCGRVVGPVRCASLLKGETISCGCAGRDIHRDLMKKRNFKHGQNLRGKRSNLYALWAAMVDRARNTHRSDAVYYAKKLGPYAIDPNWLDFSIFTEWAISHGYQDGLSIDRINNDLGYGPDNCRFINVRDQNRNKTSNRLLTYNGKTRTITDWGRATDLSWDVLNRRLKKGMSVGQALGYE